MGTIVRNEKITDRTDQSGVDYTKRNLSARITDPTTGKLIVDTIPLTEGGIATAALHTEELKSSAVVGVNTEKTTTPPSASPS